LSVRKTVQGFETQLIFGNSIGQSFLVEVDGDKMQKQLFDEKYYPSSKHRLPDFNMTRSEIRHAVDNIRDTPA